MTRIRLLLCVCSNLGLHKEVITLLRGVKNNDFVSHHVDMIRRLLTSVFVFLALFVRKNKKNQAAIWPDNGLFLRWLGFGVAAEVSLGEVCDVLSHVECAVIVVVVVCDTQLVTDNREIIESIEDSFMWALVSVIESGQLDFYLLVIMMKTIKVHAYDTVVNHMTKWPCVVTYAG